MRKRKRKCLHAQTLNPEKKEETSQLDYFIEQMRRDDEVHSHNDVRMWATWDHSPILCEDTGRRADEQICERKEKKWTGWKPKTDEQTMIFRRKVMEKNDATQEDLATIQKNIENTAGKVAHHTKAEREK